MRGATLVYHIALYIYGVSIHAPVRGATFQLLLTVLLSPVSIHAPVRGATLQNLYIHVPVPCFNPRTREGCDYLLPAARWPGYRSFNPRTREGCDIDTRTSYNLNDYVSIHAPVRGATRVVHKRLIN